MDHSLATAAPHSTPRSAPRSTRLLHLLRRLAQMRSLLRQRTTLAQLDAHLLRDVGLTPEDAQAEARRPLWDVPAHWRR